MSEWYEVLIVAAAGGVLGGSAVFLLAHYAAKPPRRKHEHRFIPQRADEDPRCIDCGKVYR